MLHACLYTICFVFCYTSWRFYAFSRTNLLTRRHSVSSLFFAVFVFQKSYTGNILEIGRNKSRTSYFPDTRRSSKMRRRGARTRPHPRAAWPGLNPSHQGVSPLVHLLTPPFRLYIPLDGKNLKADQFSMKPTTSHRRHRRKIGRVQKLFPAPCRRGESPPEAFFITMVASGVMCE
jgi:hypothetical protein